MSYQLAGLLYLTRSYPDSSSSVNRRPCLLNTQLYHHQSMHRPKTGVWIGLKQQAHAKLSHGLPRHGTPKFFQRERLSAKFVHGQDIISLLRWHPLLAPGPRLPSFQIAFEALMTSEEILLLHHSVHLGANTQGSSMYMGDARTIKVSSFTILLFC